MALGAGTHLCNGCRSTPAPQTCGQQPSLVSRSHTPASRRIPACSAQHMRAEQSSTAKVPYSGAQNSSTTHLAASSVSSTRFSCSKDSKCSELLTQLAHPTSRPAPLAALSTYATPCSPWHFGAGFIHQAFPLQLLTKLSCFMRARVRLRMSRRSSSVICARGHDSSLSHGFMSRPDSNAQTAPSRAPCSLPQTSLAAPQHTANMV